MSLFGFGRKQPSSAEKISAIEMEMRLLSGMLESLNNMCVKKCVSAEYRDGDLNKGESVCLDRCAAKYFAVHQQVSEKMQEQAQARNKTQ